MRWLRYVATICLRSGSDQKTSPSGAVPVRHILHAHIDPLPGLVTVPASISSHLGRRLGCRSASLTRSNPPHAHGSHRGHVEVVPEANAPGDVTSIWAVVTTHHFPGDEVITDKSRGTTWRLGWSGVAATRSSARRWLRLDREHQEWHVCYLGFAGNSVCISPLTSQYHRRRFPTRFAPCPIATRSSSCTPSSASGANAAWLRLPDCGRGCSRCQPTHPHTRRVQRGQRRQSLEGGQGPRGEPPTAKKEATSHSFASTASSRSDAWCCPASIVQPPGLGSPVPLSSRAAVRCSHLRSMQTYPGRNS